MAKKGQRTGEYRKCLICDSVFYVFPRDVKKGLGKFCSKKCKIDSQKGIPSPNKTGENKECLICKKYFYVPIWWKNKEAKYCSRSCYWKSKIGKRPWNYEGKTQINLAIRKTRKYRKWAKLIKERDNYTCQFCHKKGGDLHSDHIKPFSLFPKLRFDFSNGRTLCVDCHKQTETYGNKLLKIKKEELWKII